MDLRFRNWIHIQPSFRLKNHHATSYNQNFHSVLIIWKLQLKLQNSYVNVDNVLKKNLFLFFSPTFALSDATKDIKIIFFFKVLEILKKKNSWDVTKINIFEEKLINFEAKHSFIIWDIVIIVELSTEYWHKL